MNQHNSTWDRYDFLENITGADSKGQESLEESCLNHLLQTKYVDRAYAELKEPLNLTSDDDDSFSDASSTSLVWIPREVHETTREDHETKREVHETRSRSSDAPKSTSTLTVNYVTYVVKETVGSWWRNVCFKEKRKKTVLKDISMQLKAGETMAILGNSGSAKTSLLDVITCRAKGNVSGNVFYNANVCTDDFIKEHAAYVMQADRLLPNLTVRETLRYSARLKLPGNTSTSDIEAKVTAVILEMGLKDVADSLIGSCIVRGVSGGEQRRVTIAIHLLKNPDLVLLDEPTSGLDSYTARHLVSNLRYLARRGKIVLLTIHQPSSDFLQFFDQIALMSVGEMVYCGPAKSLVPYFTNLGYPCDRYTNPLDRYVDVASVDRRGEDRERKSLERVRKLVQAFRSSVLYQITTDSLSKRTQKYSMSEPPQRVQGPSYPRIMSTIISRSNRNLFRDRKDYVARILQLPFFLVFVLPFLGRLKHTQSSIQDRIGTLYQSASVPPFMGILNSVALYPCLRDVFYRESVDGLYGTTTFLLAYSIHILPFHILSSVIYSSTFYWGVGLQPDIAKYLYYTLATFLLQYWGEMLTVGCMGLFMNPNLAQSTSAFLQGVTVMIGSGFIKDITTLFKPLQWLSWALLQKYSAEIFVANEFGDLKFTDCPQNTTYLQNTTNACFSNGDQFIARYFPNSTSNLPRNFGALGAYTVCTLILAILLYKLVGPKTLH